jgi:hypothetical protein
MAQQAKQAAGGPDPSAEADASDGADGATLRPPIERPAT